MSETDTSWKRFHANASLSAGRRDPNETHAKEKRK
jgi:hypothetical protein